MQVSRYKKIYFVCIYTLYKDVLSIFDLYQGGIPENFDPENGSFENFEEKGGL